MATVDYENELTLSDYLDVLRRRWLWFVGPLLLVATLAATVSLSQNEFFTASAQVVLAPSAAQQATTRQAQNTGFLTRELTNEVNFALSDVVVDQVEDTLGDVPDVSINVDPSSDVLTFAARSNSPNGAANAANVWASTYVSAKRDQAKASIEAALQESYNRLAELRSERAELRSDTLALQERLAQTTDTDAKSRLTTQIQLADSEIAADLAFIDSQIATAGRNVADLELANDLVSSGEASIAQAASPPLTSANAPLSRNLALALVAGSILGGATALLVDSLDQGLSSADEVSKLLGVPVLASIPDPGRTTKLKDLALAVRDEPEGIVADGYARLRTSLRFASIASPIGSVLITSPNQADGKTTTATNLSHVLAAVDTRVILADCDFRRPRLHSVYGCHQSPGLTGVIVDGIDPITCVVLPDSDNEELVMIPAGTKPPNPGDIVASDKMGEVIRLLEKESDLVILDAPPVLPVSDSLSLARHVDAIVLVLNAKTTKRKSAEATVASLNSAGANLLGIVLVGTSGSDNYGGYGYSEDSK